MCCSSYDYLSSKTSRNLLGRGLVNIAVPAGGKGGQFSPKFPRFGQNSNFSGKIKIKIKQNTFYFFFLEITLISGQNFFSGQEFLENHDLGKTSLPPQNFLGWYAYAGEYGGWSIISHFSSAILASVIFATCGRALSWRNKSLNSYNRQARILLTQNNEDSFEAKKKAGAVFVDLTAAYDIVWSLSGTMALPASC